MPFSRKRLEWYFHEWHSKELSLLIKSWNIVKYIHIHGCTYPHMYAYLCVSLLLLLARFLSSVPISDTLWQFYRHFSITWGFQTEKAHQGVEMCPRGVEKAANWAPYEHTGWQQGGVAAGFQPACKYSQRKGQLVCNKPITSYLLLRSWAPTVIIMKWFHKHYYHVLNICDSVREQTPKWKQTVNKHKWYFFVVWQSIAQNFFQQCLSFWKVPASLEHTIHITQTMKRGAIHQEKETAQYEFKL